MLHPLLLGLCKKSVHAMVDNFAVDADRRSNGRHGNPEILQNLVAAFSHGPDVVVQGHDTYVHAPQILDVLFLFPILSNDPDALDVDGSRADDLQPHLRVSTADFRSEEHTSELQSPT